MDSKIINVITFDRNMGIIREDGTRVPIKGTVTETYYDNGSKSVHVHLHDSLKMISETTELGKAG